MRRSAGLQSMGTIPKMNRSAKGGARSSLHFRDEGALITTAPRCLRAARHGRTARDSGGLAESLGDTGVSGPISGSERASETLSVVGLPNST